MAFPPSKDKNAPPEKKGAPPQGDKSQQKPAEGKSQTPPQDGSQTPPEAVPGTEQQEVQQDDTANQSFAELSQICAQALVSMSQLVDRDPTIVTPEDAIGLQNAMVFLSDLSQRAGTASTPPAEGAVPASDGETPPNDPATEPPKPQ